MAMLKEGKVIGIMTEWDITAIEKIFRLTVICSVGRKNINIAGSIWTAISKWAIWRGNSAFRARYAPVKFGIVSYKVAAM